jgi:hypothetical protein
MFVRWGSPIAEAGAAVGLLVGALVGAAVGAGVGELVGAAVGAGVGELVGAAVGAGVGVAVPPNMHGTLPSLAKNVDVPPMRILRPPAPSGREPVIWRVRENSLVSSNSTITHRFDWSTVLPLLHDTLRKSFGSDGLSSPGHPDLAICVEVTLTPNLPPEVCLLENLPGTCVWINVSIGVNVVVEPN